MNKIEIYNQKGEIVGEEEVKFPFAKIKIKPELIHQAVVAILASRRNTIAHTKKRGEVRGGGKKPWRQKGTGRARAGSIRSPIWRGGGVVFGPRKEKNFFQKINKKIKKKAILMCLKDKFERKKIIVLEKFEPIEKTREFEKILMNLPIKKNKTLFFTDNEILKRVSRNLPYLKLNSPLSGLNLIDLLGAEYFLTTKEIFKKLEKNYS